MISSFLERFEGSCSIFTEWRASVLSLQAAPLSLKARTCLPQWEKSQWCGHHLSLTATVSSLCKEGERVKITSFISQRCFFLNGVVLGVFIQQTCILCPLYVQQYIKSFRLFRNGFRMDLSRQQLCCEEETAENQKSDTLVTLLRGDCF